MKKYKVVENFVSINGEGTLAGQLAVFIRFQGCNLNCSYCDTAWANETNCDFIEMTKEEIAEYIKSTGIYNVTLTGGEPLLQEYIKDLIEYLLENDALTIEIETNGSVDLATIKLITSENLKLTMDYKLLSSDMERHMCINNLILLGKKDTIKFVAGSLEDLELAKSLINQYNLIQRTNVHISPVFGKINPDTIVEWMKDNSMNRVTLQLQLHKVIWGMDTKGV